MAAVTRARPLARCPCASAPRSRRRPRRWKQTARASALRASPLFNSAVACRRSEGLRSPSRVWRGPPRRAHTRRWGGGAGEEGGGGGGGGGGTGGGGRPRGGGGAGGGEGNP